MTDDGSGVSKYQQVFGGIFLQTGPRKPEKSCKCNGGVPRAQSVEDVVAPSSPGEISVVKGVGAMAAFGPTTFIAQYPSGAITGSVPIDKKTLNYSYGVV